jgi:hypothetical protein
MRVLHIFCPEDIFILENFNNTNKNKMNIKVNKLNWPRVKGNWTQYIKRNRQIIFVFSIRDAEEAICIAV